METIGNTIKDKLKKVGKFFVILFFVSLAGILLLLIYLSIDFAFKNLLSPTARAVLSNFIVFALIIGVVLRQFVHPKAMLEVMQTEIENEIKDSENTKEESETRLEAVQKSARNVKKEINEILKKSEENAKLVGSKILQEAEKAALIIQDNTEKTIGNDIVLLKNDLIKRASLASVEVAKAHIINELNNNSELHDKLIEESIESLVIDKNEEVEEV